MMKKYGKRRTQGIIAAIVALILLARCSSPEIQESAAGQAEAEESAVEIVDFNDIPAPEQETQVQES